MSICANIGDVAGSPVWGVLGPILAAIAIWVTLWLYRRQRTRKSLAYEIKQIELVSLHRAAPKGRIKILFDDEEIQHVHLVEARIENSGNVPVTKGDFEQPIVIGLGDGATALTADVTETTPDDLRVEAKPDADQVKIQPLLLNPGDCMTLKVFVRNFQGKVQCHYRIVGIPKMDDAAMQRQNRQFSLRRWYRAAGVGTALIFSVLTSLAAGLSVAAVL